MNRTESATASWRRFNRAAMPQLPAMIEEPICSEVPHHCLDDVLLSGSDDEYYDDSDARRRRIEEQARLFLDGRRPVLLSASLRGPFGKESGWQNPWRGQGSRVPRNETARGEVFAAKSERAAAPPPPLQTVNTLPISAALPVMHRELGTIPGITALGEKTSQPKKRSASTDWLRRKNLKRMRPVYDGESTFSPTVSHVSKPAKAHTTPALARSFSAPIEPRTGSAAAVEEEEEGRGTSVSCEDSAAAVSYISDSEIYTSVPSSILWTSRSEVEGGTCVEIDETIMLDLSSSIDTGAVEADVDVDADAMEEAEADMASQQIATEEAQFESQRSSSPVPTPVDVSEDAPEPSEDMLSENSEPTPTPSRSKDDIAIVQSETSEDHETSEETKKTDDERLATQFQSPWTNTPAPTIMNNDMAEYAATPTDGTIKKLPEASTATESPWSRESQWQLTAPSSPPVLAATPTRTISASQNPWVDESAATPAICSSQPNLPTSPCSPSQDVCLPQFASEQQQEPFLPSLPIPIPAHSSGTAPSTPDTKQSSLPTPDMTMSIKSFRRFRSPTPTPPPRRKSNKKGGPRSILKQTRQRLGVTSTASSSSRRVKFSLFDNGETGAGDGTPACTEGVEADEEDFIEAGLAGTSRGRKFACDLQAKSSEARARPSQRASSPPPQDKTLMESLPSEVEKFQGHFASVAGRANGTVVSTGTVAPSRARASSSAIAILQSAEAGAEASKLQQISQPSVAASQRPRDSSVVDAVDTSSKLFPTFGKDKENAWAAETEASGGDDAEPVVDDVQEVMDHLDDFLGMWDMDAELAQVQSSRV